MEGRKAVAMRIVCCRIITGSQAGRSSGRAAVSMAPITFVAKPPSKRRASPSLAKLGTVIIRGPITRRAPTCPMASGHDAAVTRHALHVINLTIHLAVTVIKIHGGLANLSV